MYSEILDDDTEEKEIKTHFVWKPRLVLAILWAAAIYKFSDAPYYNFELIWGLVGLSVATYYVVINSSISVLATVILLGLGLFGVINHFGYVFYFSFGSLIMNLNY